MGWKKKKKEKPIVATKLPKLWGKKFNSNLGNEIAKNEGEKKDDLGRKLMGKKFVMMELPKWEGKKIVAIDLWQCCCRNGRGKKVVIDLWQWSYRKLEREKLLGFLF